MAVEPFRERGFVETLRSIRGCIHAIEQERREAFDRCYGTDTERHLSLASLCATGDDVMPLWRYAPTLRAPFRRMLTSLDVDLEEHVFVDLGCGKGRVLMMASDLPFLRISGVELSPALLSVAERNLRVYRAPQQRCFSFELICTDAALWQPPIRPLIVYLFQPFPAATMTAVLRNLTGSLVAQPRPVTLAYSNPLFHRMVIDTGVFALRERGSPEQPGEFPWAIYSTRR